MGIAIESLSYAYGTQEVLHKVSCRVRPGQIAGLLGPNGAGKSTLMRLLTAYLPAPKGSVHICGHDLYGAHHTLRRNIGYLPERNPLYEDMYAKELLRFCGKLYGLGGKALQSRIDTVITECALAEVQHKKIHTMSKGYRQRVGLARALLHAPEVLILDEPTAGLDPNQLIEIRQLIRNLGAKVCVLFSTHILQEVDALCDEVILLHQGHLLAQQPLAAFRTQYQEGSLLQVEFSRSGVDVAPLREVAGVQRIAQLSEHKYMLYADSDTDSEADLQQATRQACEQHGLPLHALTEAQQSLEDIFQQLTHTAPRAHVDHL